MIFLKMRTEIFKKLEPNAPENMSSSLGSSKKEMVSETKTNIRFCASYQLLSFVQTFAAKNGYAQNGLQGS